ncbi:hypothetical protein N9003_02380 [bacterium]|nr:hypothetical protein [bacterium]
MPLSDKHPSLPKRRWYQFRLRTMLIFITLTSVAFGIYKPLMLHLKAVELINFESGGYANRPHPDELFYDCFGSDDTALIRVGLVKIALLGRMPRGGSMGFIPITGDSTSPEQYANLSVDGYQYFSYSYADGQAECFFHGFPFLCSKRIIQINDQSFDIAAPTVVLVDSNDKILYTYSR